MATDAQDGIDRRSFLKGAAAAGAAAALAGTLAETAHAQEATGSPAAEKPAGGGQKQLLSSIVITRPGSDFMVAVMKSLEIEYLAANPGSSFRSLHESIVNYGGNSKPEFITCTHEEASVAIAHGYAKAAGKPMAILAHSTVGLQHSAMAVYNAWGDRVPIIMMAGNLVDAAKRRPGVEWYHSAIDPAALLRDITKWDDQPASLQHFAESMVRAYKIATTPPMEPTLIVADADLQETQVEDDPNLKIPKLSPSIPPRGDENALKEVARMLAAAQNPIILADRATRGPDGVKLMVQLAEAAGAPVIDLNGRMNMPNTHFANLSGMKGQLVRDADFILALEVGDLWGQLNNVGDPYHDYRRTAKPDVKVAHINLADMYMKANYQDFERYTPVDLSINGDVQATLPSLIEAIKSEVGSKAQGRLDSLKDLFQKQAEQVVASASNAWDASPISRGRPGTGRMGDPPVEADRLLPVPRRLGRFRRGLRRPRGRGRGPGQQGQGHPDGPIPERRRHAVPAGRPVDGCPPQHPDPEDHVQQPGLPPGGDAPAAHGLAARAARRPGGHRHHHHQPGRRFRQAGSIDGRVVGWADHRPQPAWQRA